MAAQDGDTSGDDGGGCSPPPAKKPARGRRSGEEEEETAAAASLLLSPPPDNATNPNPDEEPPKTQESTTTTTEETPRRLMIDKMILENFKSYGGKVEIGPFHHCFSSVVGPNGSGKSNVIDAMLFVFGKRAKQLRLAKIRELIHQSDGHEKPTSATVTVHMHEIVDLPVATDEDCPEAEDRLPYRIVPNSQVVLSRTAKSDNTSVYKLNGKTTQFRDIAQLLRRKGIDLDHNRFLILQGEVELISLMPPKAKHEGDQDGLLEYLEDIIGSHQFVPATQHAAEQVEALTVQRQEKLNRVKAAEQETKALEAAKAEAHALLRRERDLRQCQSQLYQVQRLAVSRHAAPLHAQHETLEQQLHECHAHAAAARERTAAVAQAHQDRWQQHELAHAELLKTEQDFVAYERRDIKLRETLKHAKQTRHELTKQSAAQDAKTAAAQDAHDAALARIPELEQQLAHDLPQALAVEEAALEEVQAASHQATLRLRTDLEGQTQALAPLLQERAVRQAALDTAQTELTLHQTAAREARERLHTAQHELDTLQARHDANRQALQRDEADLSQRQEQLVALEKRDAEQLGPQEAQTAKRLQSLLSRTETAKAALESNGGPKKSPAVQGILQASRQGGPLSKVGVLGRLGDLATIDAKYDVAVSTACGGYLDHIVVQTTAGAQRCLDFLRHHNLGRANFIPLDKMKKGAHDRVVETPDGAPRLLQLVQPVSGQPPASVMAALLLAVGDTLVAPDLETATRWAYDFGKRWRVVTLDGKLLETAGTLSGGGKAVRKGGMKLRNVRATTSANAEVADDGLDVDVKKLEEEQSQTQEQLQQIRQERRSVAEQIRDLKRQIKELERSLPRLRMEIASFDSTRENLTQLIPQLRQQTKQSAADEEQEQALQAKVTQCQEELEECVAQAAELEKEVARLKKAILNAGGPALKKQQAKYDKALQDIKDAEKALSQSKVAMSSATKAMKKAAEVKAQTEEQLVESEALLEETKAALESLEEDALAVSEAYDKVKEAAAAAKADLEDMERAVEEARRSHAECQGKEVELSGQVEAVAKQLAEDEQKIRHWNVALEKLLKVARKDERELWNDEDDDNADEEEEAQEQEEDGDKGAEMEEEDDDDEEEEDKGDAEDEEGDAEMQDDDAETEEMEEEPAAAEQAVDKDTERLKASYPTYSESQLDRFRLDDLKEQIAVFETERNALAKTANLGAIAEYRKKEADYLARVGELDEVTEQRNNVRREYDELRRKRLDMFMDGFSIITLKLKEMYQMITLGGDAELELVDSLDPFSEGIVFSVRPPKKSWKNISNLSGGEKTLSSLALVFALHHFKPTPLYVMDEIDAALDYKNVSIVANYIKDRTKNAQFIIISLRNNMFELADRLVGVYKTFNRSKSISINPEAFHVESQQDGHVGGASATPKATTAPLWNRTNRTDSNVLPDDTSKRGSAVSTATENPTVT